MAPSRQLEFLAEVDLAGAGTVGIGGVERPAPLFLVRPAEATRTVPNLVTAVGTGRAQLETGGFGQELVGEGKTHRRELWHDAAR